MFNSLEGDGVIENIYHFLWTKDTIFNTQHSIHIPQTILYKYKKPLYWYFTSVVDHKLKKKNFDKLNNEYIKDIFLKNVSKSGIVCYFIYSKKSVLSKYETDKPTFEKTMKRIINNIDISNSDSYMNNNNEQIDNAYNLKKSRIHSTYSYNKPRNIQKDEFKIRETKYIIEYYDKKQFLEFLNNKPKSDEGILQKFEDPKGDYNTIYRIIWSPKISLFEKCSNLKKLNDKHFDIYERAVTYDGEEFQTKKEPVKGSHIPEGMQNIALKIANHVGNITLEKIKIVRMVLNFKVDKKDRIIFLWCSSLRIDPGIDKKLLINKRNKSFSGPNSNSNANKNNIRETRIKSVDDSKIKFFHADNINIFKYSVLGKPINPHKEGYCPNCGLNVENYKLYEISFKNLIESNENLKRDNQYFSLYDKINMTSNGIEVISPEDKYSKNTNKKNILRQLKYYNYKNFLIPKVIYELFPKITIEDYNTLKKDIVFLNKKTFVCDLCYLEITKYCSMAGSNDLNLLKSSKRDKNIANDINDFNNYFFKRPKSAYRFNMNKFKNKNNFTSALSKNNIKKMLKRTNSFKSFNNKNKKNLYQNYITNMNKTDRKDIKNCFIQSYNENKNNRSHTNTNSNEKANMKRKLNKNKIKFTKNSIFNRLNYLSQENDKEINKFFIKNGNKISKYAQYFNGIKPKINVFENGKKNIKINSNIETEKTFPIKILKKI